MKITQDILDKELKIINICKKIMDISDKELKVLDKNIKTLININYNKDNAFQFFEDYDFWSYFTVIKEDKKFLFSFEDYTREPIKMRKGKKIDKLIKKRKGIWIPARWKYHRSRFMKKGCLLSDTKLINENKIKFLNFFFQWFRKQPRAYYITKIFNKKGNLPILDENISNGDRIILSFNVYKAAWKKLIMFLDKERKFIPDYKRIRRRGHSINFTFMFFDLDPSTQNLMFDFSGRGYDDCDLLIILNKTYLKYFYESEWLYQEAVEWYDIYSEIREFNFRRNVYTYKHLFLFEFWKAYQLNYWFRKYWDPHWYKIVGQIYRDIKYYQRQTIINTKRYAMNVSREEAIKLVEEDRLRAKAENVILKQQMKEKLAALQYKMDVENTYGLIERFKKDKGIELSFAEGFEEYQLFQIRARKRFEADVRRNKRIYRAKKAEEKRLFEPKRRDLRIFKF